MANATLTKATDTPRAAKAPVTPKPNTAVVVTKGTATKSAPATTAAKKWSMSKVDGAAFVKACKAETASHLLKIRIAGKPAIDGVSSADIKSSLVSYLKLASVPESMASAVSHYINAYKLTYSHLLHNDDVALGELYKLAHGYMPIATLTARVAAFVPTSPETKSAEFVAMIAALKLEFKKGGKKTPDTAPDTDTEPAEKVEAESISPVAEFAAIMKQAAKLLALASAADDKTDYYTMYDAALSFAVDAELVDPAAEGEFAE